VPALRSTTSPPTWHDMIGRSGMGEGRCGRGCGAPGGSPEGCGRGFGVPGGGLEDGVRDERVAKAVNSGISPCFRD
jgi:hypothetical protein